MIRVAIFEDNPSRRESLKMLIELAEHLEFYGSYTNCVDIDKKFSESLPDIVLMDIDMPEKDGLFGVHYIKEHFPEVKVIMQTVFEDADKIFTCLQHGAKGYLLKNAPSSEIIHCIESVYQGGAFMTASVALKVMSYFNKTEKANSELDKLTPKEKEVLLYLADGLSYKMIADRMQIAAGTVNNHLKKVYDKLQVHSAGEAISKVYKQQW